MEENCPSPLPPLWAYKGVSSGVRLMREQKDFLIQALLSLGVNLLAQSYRVWDEAVVPIRPQLGYRAGISMNVTT